MAASRSPCRYHFPLHVVFPRFAVASPFHFGGTALEDPLLAIAASGSRPRATFRHRSGPTELVSLGFFPVWPLHPFPIRYQQKFFFIASRPPLEGRTEWRGN